MRYAAKGRISYEELCYAVNPSALVVHLVNLMNQSLQVEISEHWRVTKRDTFVRSVDRHTEFHIIVEARPPFKI